MSGSLMKSPNKKRPIPEDIRKGIQTDLKKINLKSIIEKGNAALEKKRNLKSSNEKLIELEE